MGVLLNTTDIHLTTVVGAIEIPTTLPFSIVTKLSTVAWNSGINTTLLGLFKQDVAAAQVGSKGGNAIDCWNWGGDNLVSSGALFPLSADPVTIGYTWDGSNQHSLYANGNLIIQTTGVMADTVLDQFYINGYPTGLANETSQSLIDEVGIYSRELRLDEIAEIHKLSIHTSGIFEGLEALYELAEEAVGSTVVSCYDFSANKAHLSVTGPGTPLTYALSINSLGTRRIHS